MSRKIRFARLFGETVKGKVDISVGPHHTTINGILFNNCLLWDALVEAMVAIPNNTSDQGLLRRRKEAQAALASRVAWLRSQVEEP